MSKRLSMVRLICNGIEHGTPLITFTYLISPASYNNLKPLRKPQNFFTNENTQHAQSISKYRGEIDFGKKLIDWNSLLKMQTMKDMQERGLTKSCSGDRMFRKGEREKRENLLIPSIALYFTSHDTHMHVFIQ